MPYPDFSRRKQNPDLSESAVGSSLSLEKVAKVKAMAHVLILGMTESGKSTLAAQLTRHYKTQGRGVLVLDPLRDPRWISDYQTTDPNEFLEVVKESRSCMVFIDESGESVGQYDTEMHWLATRGRHYGHSCHFVSQRGAQIAKTVRDQCSHLFLFCCSMDDAKLLANEFNKPEIREANTLGKGEYFHVSRFGEVERCRVIFGQ